MKRSTVRLLAAILVGLSVFTGCGSLRSGGEVSVLATWTGAEESAFRKVLDQHPDWRTLIFMGGYHGLRNVGGEVKLGRAHDRHQDEKRCDSTRCLADADRQGVFHRHRQ